MAQTIPNDGLIAWYRADDYTAGDWPDRTANSHDFSQATEEDQPEAIADGGADLNNQPVVRLSDSETHEMTTSSFLLAQPLTMVAICKATRLNSSTKTMIFGRTDSGDASRIVWSDDEVMGYNAGSFVFGSTGNDVPVLVEAFFNGSSSVLRGNSSVEATGDPGSNGIATGLFLGNIPSGNQPWSGDIAEIAVYDRELTHLQRAQWARYAAERYGFDAPFPQTEAPTETSFSTASTTHNVDMPSEVEEGELLTVNITLRKSNTGAAAVITTPTGWVQKSNQTDEGDTASDATFDIYCKISDGTEGGTSVNFESDASTTGAAQCHKDSLWHGDLSEVEVGAGAVGEDTNPDSPSLSPSWGSANTLWRSVAGWVDDDVAVSSYATDYTDGVDTTSGAGADSGAATGSCRRENATTTEDPGTWTLASSEAWLAQTIAVRPIIVPATTRTASLSGILFKQGVLQTASADAVLLANFLSTTTADAILRAGLNRTTDADAVLLADLLQTADADAILRASQSTTSNINAILLKTFVNIALAAVVVQKGMAKSTSVDAVLKRFWQEDDKGGSNWQTTPGGSGTWNAVPGGSTNWGNL